MTITISFDSWDDFDNAIASITILETELAKGE